MSFLKWQIHYDSELIMSFLQELKIAKQKTYAKYYVFLNRIIHLYFSIVFYYFLTCDVRKYNPDNFLVKNLA